MPENTAPYEIIAAPFTVWLAPVGTAFPLPSAAPAVAWIKLGTDGDLNYTEDGVTVEHGQTIEVFRAFGSTGPRKAFRTEEELKISLVLADLSLEQYAVAMNYNTITPTVADATNPGMKAMGLSRGMSVAQRALLVRGPSPYGDAWAMQFEVPRVVQSGNPKPVMRKGEPAGLELEFMALEDLEATVEEERFGRLVAQTDDVGI